MPHYRPVVNAVLTPVIFVLAACSSGGGSDAAPTGPQVPASVPAGSGLITIQMAGTWEVRDSIVVDTNSPNAEPPPNGTQFVLESNRVQSINGLSIDPGFLELFLGSPLVTYVNQVDGNTLLYGLSIDARESGGTREEVGVAGGAIDDSTIAIEMFTSTQSPSDAQPVFVVSRYQLVRISASIPALIEFETDRPFAADEQELLQKRLWAPFGSR